MSCEKSSFISEDSLLALNEDLQNNNNKEL